MKFEKCLLASDIDGTLMEHDYISPRNFSAIEYFVSQGGTFCLSTGRCTPAIDHIVSQFKNLTHSIVYNGGMIYDYIKDKPVFENLLCEEDKGFFKYLLENIPEMGVEVYCGRDIYLLNHNVPCQVHCDYEHLKPKLVSYDDISGLNWNKAMCMYYAGFDESRIEKLINEYEFVDSDFTKAAFELDGVRYRGYEQLPKGAHKGYGLKKMGELLGIKEGCTFAIGDYFNDAEMLKQADISACPKDSPQEIKDIVDFVGCSCSDGTVADFIEYLSKTIQSS
ncbi:MAG: HAD-IIB family hydrolase [Acutalibacteraceae bacterium]|nr:HAD-IIB family hydrolase [Acutalibacteraceae bacterium]